MGFVPVHVFSLKQFQFFDFWLCLRRGQTFIFSSSPLNLHVKISFDTKFCFAFLHSDTSFYTFIKVSYVGLFIELSQTELLNNIRSKPSSKKSVLIIFATTSLKKH